MLSDHRSTSKPPWLDKVCLSDLHLTTLKDKKKLNKDISAEQLKKFEIYYATAISTYVKSKVGCGVGGPDLWHNKKLRMKRKFFELSGQHILPDL